MYKKFTDWRRTRQGAIIGAIVAFVLTYLLFSLAIDNGSLIVYAIGFIFLYDAFKLTFRSVRIHSATSKSVKKTSKKRKTRKAA